MAKESEAPRFSLASVLGLGVTSAKETGQPVQVINFARNRFDAPLRVFIAHTSGAFLAFRSALEEKTEGRQLISRVSKLYRSALAQLNESRANEGYPTHVFRAVESVWQLCEILIIDPQTSPGVLIQQLQQWASAWSSSPIGKKSPKGGSDSEDDEGFWDNFMTLIMLGQIEDACTLLRCHKCGNREDFLLMTKVLESVPVVRQGVHHQFLQQWTEWKDTVRQLMEEGRFDEEPRFHSACRLLSGDSAELDRRKDLCDSWFQYAVSKAAYTQPLIKASELGRLADEVLTKNDFVSTDLLSQLVLSLFHGDLQAFTRQLANLDDLWWTGAHLVDLLYAGHDLQNRNVPHVEALHEQLLRDYALCLLSQRPLWETGLMYLQHCKSDNRRMLVEALVNVHCPTQSKALKAAAVADRLGLPEAALSIYRIQSMHWIKRGKLDLALTWAIRSKNSPLVSRVAELLLEEYQRSGKLPCADQLQGLGQDMLVSERLMFLAKYAEFLKIRGMIQSSNNDSNPDTEAGDIDRIAQATDLLLFLINSEWSPNFFVTRLLEDAAQLLTDDRLPPQNVAYLQRLMGCLQSVIKSRPSDLKKDLLDQLNYACARRTAQSLLSMMQFPQENTITT